MSADALAKVIEAINKSEYTYHDLKNAQEEVLPGILTHYLLLLVVGKVVSCCLVIVTHIHVCIDCARDHTSRLDWKDRHSYWC